MFIPQVHNLYPSILTLLMLLYKRISVKDIEKVVQGYRWLYNIIDEVLKIRERKERKVNNEVSKKSEIYCCRCMNIKQGGWFNTLYRAWRFLTTLDVLHILP